METGKAYDAFRKQYHRASLRRADADPDPIQQFKTWFFDAIEEEVPEVNAMALGTAHEGRPSVRIVLLKGFDHQGFVFYTNYQSRKGQELIKNPFAALNFFWYPMERQIRIEGTVEKVDSSESDEYYQSRDKGSRIGAWASPQSRVVESRQALEARIQEFQERYKDTDEIPRPEHWGGFRLRPTRIEFWQGRPSRLHDRLCYSLQEDGSWTLERLAP